MQPETVPQMVIGQAQGVLMQHWRLSADEALALLRLSAHLEGLSVTEVARRLLHPGD